jgi:hypothetical protein
MFNVDRDVAGTSGDTPPLILQQNALMVKQRFLPIKEPDADWDGALLRFLPSVAAV